MTMEMKALIFFKSQMAEAASDSPGRQAAALASSGVETVAIP